MMRAASRLPSTLATGSMHDVGRLRRMADWIAGASVATCLWMMPLAMGGRHVWGRLLFLGLVAIGLAADTLRLERGRSPHYRVSAAPFCVLV
ncbi:MAG TPA: hypothetical protein ENJ16_00400, partial [Planctomycetaceae bacterium]|nr:hypothetical protein [Planctomycetaceae bacterium]